LSKLRELALSVTPAERASILATLSPDELLAFLYDWQKWARPSQRPPPGDWRVLEDWMTLYKAEAAKVEAARVAGKANDAARASRPVVRHPVATRPLQSPWT
jgi:hypothetical protein